MNCHKPDSIFAASYEQNQSVTQPCALLVHAEAAERSELFQEHSRKRLLPAHPGS
jgi:hypothetical protein